MGKILLKNGTVWSADGMHTQDILIEDKIITQVADCIQDENADTLDMTGYTLYPGFFNAHVHLYGIRGKLPEELIQRWVTHGVTTIRDMGMTHTDPVCDYISWLDSMTDERYPMILHPAKILCCENTYGSTHPLGMVIGEVIEDSPQAAVAAVDQMLDNGAQFIKTGMDIGQDPEHPYDMISEATFRAICSRASARGSRTAAHITHSEELVKAAQWGLDEGAHALLNHLSDQQLDQLTACRQLSFCATLSVFDFAASMSGEAIMENAIQNTGRMYRAGIPMAVGTDFMRENLPYQEAGIPRHEFQLLFQAGLTIDEIIKAATIDSARVCGVDHLVGTLEPGKLANVVGIDVPVDESFDAFEEVPFVINRGTIVQNKLKL